MDTSVLPLAVEDTPWVMRLVEAAGWNQTPRDWQRMIGYQPDGCYKAVQSEQGVGTVTTTSYGKALGWIGMMLVAPECRRAGVGTLLMRQALHYLESQQVQSIYLDATPLGQPLYDKLGFTAEFIFQRWRREAAQASPNEPVIARSDVALAHQLAESQRELDGAAFGVDRQAWLERLAADSRLVTSTGGYGMLRQGRIASYLGPVVARSPEEAAQLIAWQLADIPGAVIWDIPRENHAIEPLARRLGFTPVRTLTRMSYSQPLVGARRELQYALSDPATG